MAGHLGTVTKRVPLARCAPMRKEIAWAAGFLEAEACFRRTGNGRGCDATLTQTEVAAKFQHAAPLDHL